MPICVELVMLVSAPDEFVIVYLEREGIRSPLISVKLMAVSQSFRTRDPSSYGEAKVRELSRQVPFNNFC
jgi:hypothetical protein